MLARGRMLDVAGRATHVHDAGSGSAVLLLHGSGPGTTAAAWTPLAAALAQRHRVIAPDLAGFGSSEPKPASAAGWHETWLTQALGLLDALEIETCAVVGNSAGGAIALSIAHARPRAVTRVVAVGSMGHPMSLPEGLDELWAYQPSAGAARALLELLNHDPAAATPDAVQARLQATLAQPHYPSLFPAPRQRWVDDLSLSEAQLSEIEAPVLLVHGAQDRVVPLEHSALALLRLLPDVRLHVFGRTGHASPVERTSEFNGLLTTFLETHE
jgi:pimeloyl-ACP methyl ester carboxylesterase